MKILESPNHRLDNNNFTIIQTRKQFTVDCLVFPTTCTSRAMRTVNSTNLYTVDVR